MCTQMHYFVGLLNKNISYIQVRQRANEGSKALDIMHLLHNGEQMHNMMQEKFNWQQFKGRLQMNNIAVMGHSFGGATTVQTLYTDKRFRLIAVISIIIMCLLQLKQMWNRNGLLYDSFGGGLAIQTIGSTTAIY